MSDQDKRTNPPSPVSFDALALLVEEILRHPWRDEREWSLQGMGMLRTYLSKEVRLHVWDSRYRIPNVSMIHDHPWHFDSLVVRGTIRNQRYSVKEGLLHKEGRIVCGPSPTRKGACDVRDVALIDRPIETYGPGDSYTMNADEVHESDPIDGTVTICRRRAAPRDSETARVYWDRRTEWVSAEPRAASTAEVFAITQMALGVRHD